MQFEVFEAPRIADNDNNGGGDTIWNAVYTNVKLQKLAAITLRFDISPDHFTSLIEGVVNGRNVDMDLDNINVKTLSTIYNYKLCSKFPKPFGDDTVIVKFAEKTLEVSKSMISFHSEMIKNIINDKLLCENNVIEFKTISHKIFKLIVSLMYNPSNLEKNFACLFRVGFLNNLMLACEMLDLKIIIDYINNNFYKCFKYYKSVYKFYFEAYAYRYETTEAEMLDAEARLLSEPAKTAFEGLESLLMIMDKFSMFASIKKFFKYMFDEKHEMVCKIRKTNKLQHKTYLIVIDMLLKDESMSEPYKKYKY